MDRRLHEINDVGEVLSRVAQGDIAAPRSLKSDVPPTLEAICRKAMSVRQEDRYQSVRGLAADIESWLADEPVQGVPEPLARRMGTWERKHRAFLRVSAVALFAVTAVAVVAALGVNAARERAESRRRQADLMSEVAEARKQEADRQRDALRRLTTRLTLDRGLGLLESGSQRPGVLWLSRSLLSAAGQDDQFEPAIRANLAAWNPLIHRLRDCLGGGAAIKVVAFSPAGRTVAIASDDGIVRLWDPGASGSSGASPRTLKHAGAVHSLAFSRDGKVLASGCDDQTAWLWNTASGLPRGEPMQHRGAVVSVAFSPDESTLVSASGDGLVRIWDVATGRLRGEPLEHGKPLKSALIAPDGKSIASVDSMGGSVVWDVLAGKPRFKLTEEAHDVEELSYQPRFEPDRLRGPEWSSFRGECPRWKRGRARIEGVARGQDPGHRVQSRRQQDRDRQL